MADILPYRMRVELERETRGESLLWAGRSSGVIERIQAGLLIAFGAGTALLNSTAPHSVAAAAMASTQPGGYTDEMTLGLSVLSLVLFAIGLGIAAYGWHRARAATRILWAVTDRRLVRMVSRSGKERDSWPVQEILGVQRLNWNDPLKRQRGLAVTVAGTGDENPVLYILGPRDLHVAESALKSIIAAKATQ